MAKPRPIMPAQTALIRPLEEPHWYAAYTRPNHEKKVAEHLQSRNVELFCPLGRTTRRWNNRCKVTVESPLFPCYVFVHMVASERLRVLELSSVISIVGTSAGPTPLADEQMERLRSGLQVIDAEPHPLLTAGTKVRICRGPLEGLRGIVAAVKNRFRVVLTLELIMKSVAVEVPAGDVECVAEPHAHRLATAAQVP
jgi:transcription antitermination factor NusG